jgi:nucleotide-binding universal stress UspA family protein
MIQKILVAVDGSDASIEAMLYSANIADMMKSELIILTVVRDARSYLQEDITSIDLAGYTNELNNYYIKKQEKFLVDLNSKYKTLKVSTFVKKGNPSKTIIETSKNNNVDLIVLGNRGTGGIISWMLGGTGRNVVEACTVSVLVVKDEKYCELKSL